MAEPPRLALALVHYPVRGREGEITSTAVTPMSVHDLARVAKTYDLDALYVVTPLRSQQALLRRIERHWTEGFGAAYNPSRREALETVRILDSLNEAVQDMAGRHDAPPRLVATGASGYHRNVTFDGLRRDMFSRGGPWLLLLGTSWGLDRGVMDECDCIVEPIAGRAGYNHLPVREAAAIMVDRLLGRGAPDLE